MTRDDILALLKEAANHQLRVGKTHIYPSYTCNALLMTSEDMVDNDVVGSASDLFNAAPDIYNALMGLVENNLDPTVNTNPYNGRVKKKPSE